MSKNPSTNQILDFAAMSQGVSAIGDAVLEGDLQEARFRARLLATEAADGGFINLSKAVADLIRDLGPPGIVSAVPRVGISLIRVADEMDAIELDHRQPQEK